MITFNTPQVTSVTIDTVRLRYVELSFDNPNARAIIQYGSTAADGTFIEVRNETVNLDAAVDGLAQALSDARDAFEVLLLVAPPEKEAVLTKDATQVTEATVGTLSVGKAEPALKI